MDKNRWLEFLSANLRAQILQEGIQKAQVWMLGALALLSFGFAVSGLSEIGSRTFLFSSKILYLLFFHGVILLGVLLPNLLQKGEGALSRIWGIRDFTSMTCLYLLGVISLIATFMISWQVIGSLEDAGLSNFFGFAVWFNVALVTFYLCAIIFDILSFSVFPNVLVKMIEKAGKILYIFGGLHLATLVFLFFGYASIVNLGSMTFFEQVRIVGLFWIFQASLILLVGKVLKGSITPALSSLELEVASGKLERTEDILSRFKDSFILRRLAFWIKRISHRAATYAHEIAQHTHDAVAMAEKKEPTELDLQQVEERYKKANGLFHKLERENQRFLLCISVFDLTEAEREKVEALRDIFSKELRNAKLELASVRKRIDDKLVSIKNNERPQITADVPVEEEQVAASKENK